MRKYSCPKLASIGKGGKFLAWLYLVYVTICIYMNPIINKLLLTSFSLDIKFLKSCTYSSVYSCMQNTPFWKVSYFDYKAKSNHEKDGQGQYFPVACIYVIYEQRERVFHRDIQTRENNV